MQSCLLTPFKGVNTAAIGLYAIFLMAYMEVKYSLLHYLLLIIRTTIYAINVLVIIYVG